MKNKAIKKFFITIVMVCVSICCSLGVGFSIYYSAKANSSLGEEKSASVETFLQSVYKEGDIVTLPTVNGAERILYDPNGNGYINESVQLNQAGQWQLVYRSENDTAKYEFIVYPSLSSSTGTKSKVAVGKMGDYSKYDAQGRSGIFTQVAYNESVTFNQIIDFSDKTRNDTVLEFSVFPETYPVEDASILVLTFTDIDNPDNEVQVHLRAENAPTLASWSMRCVYIRSGATGQKGLGIEKHNDGIYISEGTTYKVHAGDYNDLWGSPATFSLRSYGQGTSESNVGSQVFGLSMDYAERKLFCYTRNSGAAEGPHLINDLDDMDLYGDTLWNGFTSGKCRLTVSAKNYKTTAFTMLITKLGDQTEFTSDYVVNNKSAEITVVDADMSRISNIVLGKSFKVPQAVAFDAFGTELKVNTSVYTAYKTGSQANIDIKSGYFTPKQLRDYTLVYSCVDRWGNKTESVYTLPVIAEDDYDPFAISINSSAEKTKIGQEIVIKQPTVADNYIGRYTIEITARLGAETIPLATYTNNDAFPETVFKPMKAGTWIIAYKYFDMATEGVKFYSVVAEGGGQSYFEEGTPVPKYIIRGASYTLPELYGYDFSGQESAYTKAQVYISENRDITGVTEYKDNQFVVENAVNKIYITYVLNSAVEQYEIPVIDVGYQTENQSATAYFYGHNGEPNVGNNGTIYNVVESNGRYVLGFANQVQAYNFRSDLKVPVDATYSKVSMYLTDATDLSNVLKLSYSIAENGTIFYSINDGSKKPVGALLKGDSFSFRYSTSTKSATFLTLEEKIITNLAGEKWQGFSSNMVWLEIELEEVTGTDTRVEIGGINNQRFYDADSFELLDMMPEFYQDTAEISAVNNIGTKIVIPQAYAADVLAVGCKITLVATDSNGNYLTSVDGIELNKVDANRVYEVELLSYGEYIFQYTVMDDFGRINKKGMFQVSVEDTVAPIVQIASHANSVNLNETIQIADIVITDNIDEAKDCTYTVYVECPNYDVFVMSLQENKTAFVATMKGTYTIHYIVMDKAGNAVMVSYSVYVK